MITAWKVQILAGVAGLALVWGAVSHYRGVVAERNANAVLLSACEDQSSDRAATIEKLREAERTNKAEYEAEIQAMERAAARNEARESGQEEENVRIVERVVEVASAEACATTALPGDLRVLLRSGD